MFAEIIRLQTISYALQIARRTTLRMNLLSTNNTLFHDCGTDFDSTLVNAKPDLFRPTIKTIKPLI